MTAFLPTWHSALTIAERLAALGHYGQVPDGVRSASEVRVRRRIDTWRSQFPFLRDDILRAVIETHRVELEDVIRIIAQPSGDLVQDSMATPAWLVDVTDGFSLGTESAVPHRGDHDIGGFLDLVAPLIGHACNRLVAGATDLIDEFPEAPFDTDVVEQTMRRAMPGLLLPIISGTLVLELNVRRVRRELHGDDAHSRFLDFCAGLGRRDVASLILREYPVLARQIAERLSCWTRFYLELLTRMCRDWRELRDVFSSAGDLGRLSTVHWRKGDSHRQGRQVVVVEFTSGVRVVYKPKALAVDVHFQELLDWFNTLGGHLTLRTMRVVDRGTYGWVEFIPFGPCDSFEEVERFYERQGAYLAILHVLDATDVHLQNLVASGEFPYLVDLETLFHPGFGAEVGSRDPSAAFLRSSVLRIGLLPHRSFAGAFEEGVDLSGLGGEAGQLLPFDLPVWHDIGTDTMCIRDDRIAMSGSHNRPELNGEKVDVGAHVEALTRGFASTYRLLREHRRALLDDNGPLMSFANDETRVVLRPTVTYSSLLQASYHPDVLRDGLDRDVLLGWLWLGAQREPRLAKVVHAELEDLRHGDIPMFVTNPSSGDLWTSWGEQIPAYFDECAISRCRRAIAEMDEEDLQRQLWLVRASIGASISNRGPSHPTIVVARRDATIRKQQLVDASVSIGQRLVRAAIRGDDRTVSWLGFRRGVTNRWLVQPAGIDLYDGVPGIVLFLAQLGAITHSPIFQDTARAGLNMARVHLGRMSRGPVSIGAFDGLGGLVYLLTHLGCIWHDQELLDEASKVAKDLATRVDGDRMLDVMGGTAGALIAILRLHSVAGDSSLVRIAETLGNHLVRTARPMPSGCAWQTVIPSRAPLTVFSHGASGIGLALLELSVVTDSEEFRALALDAFSYERSCFSAIQQNWPDFRTRTGGDAEIASRTGPVGWCHGAPGCGLARLKALAHVDTSVLRKEIYSALSTTLQHGFGWGHCLCRGELGNLDVLLHAHEVLRDDDEIGDHIDRIVGGLADTANSDRWLLDQPAGGESPGLMTGLAGIGYGLLRAAYPGDIPSVLALDAPIPIRD